MPVPILVTAVVPRPSMIVPSNVLVTSLPPSESVDWSRQLFYSLPALLTGH